MIERDEYLMSIIDDLLNNDDDLENEMKPYRHINSTTRPELVALSQEHLILNVCAELGVDYKKACEILGFIKPEKQKEEPNKKEKSVVLMSAGCVLLLITLLPLML
jgi:hypothetical protein